MSADLLAEFVAAVAGVRRRDFDMLETGGVPRSFLWHGPMRFGVAAIEPNPNGTYEMIDGGELAFLLPAIPLPSEDDDVGDLVAWRSSRPEKWWRRAGVVTILNPLAVYRAEIMREPLTVFSSPLEWLRGAGHGVVILDWSANLRLHLGGVERIVTDTIDLGEAIERRLREPTPAGPKIFVMRAA